MDRKNSRAWPLLVGYVDSVNDIRVWCPFCKSWHIHGFLSKGAKVEHRVAHCSDPRSPFLDGGYFIGLAPKANQ